MTDISSNQFYNLFDEIIKPFNHFKTNNGSV